MGGKNVDKFTRRKSNHCAWCGKPTAMEAMQLPETPILEFMEEKINKHGRNEIWGENGDWSTQRLDPDFEAELLVYDQMLCSVSKKTVCIHCLKEDDELWEKYYGDKNGDLEIRFDADF
tara:strand:+ start:788 stop:1144 length:357 start_codon:yes stop_codon:yes gene_type:complete